MDFGSSDVSMQSAPILVADTRPSADVAASKSIKEPALPFAVTGMPPSTSQAASVSRSMLLATGVEESDKTRSVSAISETERTLKPYGMPMLPDETVDSADTESDADTSAQEPEEASS